MSAAHLAPDVVVAKAHSAKRTAEVSVTETKQRTPRIVPARRFVGEPRLLLFAHLMSQPGQRAVVNGRAANEHRVFYMAVW